MQTVTDETMPWSSSTSSKPTSARRSCSTAGRGCWVYDTDGNAYLDCVAGIAVNALGHAHPDLVATLTEQAGKLWHVSNLYHTAPQPRLAQKLCDSSFADRVFFCNSGAEANEGAFKFARKWAHDNFGPEKHVIVAFSNAFHGRTFGALAATPREKYQAPFRPLLPGVRIAPFNDLAGTGQYLAPPSQTARCLRGDHRAGAGRRWRLSGRRPNSWRGCASCATATTRC